MHIPVKVNKKRMGRISMFFFILLTVLFPVETFAQKTAFEEVHSHQLDNFVFSISFSPDGKQLAIGTQRTVHVLDVQNKFKPIKSFRVPGGFVYDIVFSPDGRFLAARTLNPEAHGTGTGTVKVVDVRNNFDQVASYSFNGKVYSIAFSPDGTYFATGSAHPKNKKSKWMINGGIVKVFDTGDEFQNTFSKTYKKTIRLVDFSPKGKFLVAGSSIGGEEKDGNVFLFSTEDKFRQVGSYSHERTIKANAFSPDGRYLATSSARDVVKIVNLQNNFRQVASIPPKETGNSMGFSPDGTFLAIARHYGTVNILNPKKKFQQVTSFKQNNHADIVRFSPNGRFLFAAVEKTGGESTLRVYDVKNDFKEIPSTLNNYTRTFAVSSEDQFLAIDHGKQGVTIFRISQKK